MRENTSDGAIDGAKVSANCISLAGACGKMFKMEATIMIFL